MNTQGSSAEPHVVIAGGGIAGLEALLAVRDLAGERVATLVAPDPDFVYKPLIVEEPFSSQPAEQHALRTDGTVLPIDSLLRETESSESKVLAFVIPPARTWPLPVYELALMAQKRAIELGIRDVAFLIVTPEESPLIVFGSAASDAVSSLLAGRGIEIRTGVRVKEAAKGELVLVPEDERISVGQVISLPVLEGPNLAGVPADAEGFIPIDDHARVRGIDDVYAAGDGTNFPIKHGGIGTEEADAAAQQIAASLGAEVDPEPFRPVIRGKLLTGDDSLHMQHDAAGGGGEGTASPDSLWWPPQKVAGRYLSAWLGHTTMHAESEPPSYSIDVEVALPQDWHEDPMALDPLSP